MIKSIYIAGKITGEPIVECIRKFNNAEIEIYLQFREPHPYVYIPLRLPGIHFGISHAEAMKICLEALKECTHIDRKSTRLNSSHVAISYAVFCLKKKHKTINATASPEHDAR